MNKKKKRRERDEQHYQNVRFLFLFTIDKYLEEKRREEKKKEIWLFYNVNSDRA